MRERGDVEAARRDRAQQQRADEVDPAGAAAPLAPAEADEPGLLALAVVVDGLVGVDFLLPVVLDEIGRLAEPELHGLVQPLVIPLLRGRRRFGADDELDPHLLDGGGSICLLELLQVAHALVLAVGVAEVERHLLLDLELLAQRRPQGRQAVRRDVDAPGGGDELRLQDEQRVVAAAGGAVADRALPRQLRHRKPCRAAAPLPPPSSRRPPAQ